MKATTLLTDNYLRNHRLFCESMILKNKWFEDVEHIILYKPESLTNFEYIRKYLNKVTFVKIPSTFFDCRNTRNNLYKHFEVTYDKLYMFFCNELKGEDFIIYDADMVCLRSFEIPVFNVEIRGAKDISGNVNSGFMLVGKDISKNASYYQRIIYSYEDKLVSLPDQEIINVAFPCQYLENITILMQPLLVLPREDLKYFDIYHYITENKNIETIVHYFDEDIQELIKKIYKLC